MGIIPSNSHDSTIVWVHYLNFNEMPGEKAWWELIKDAACCVEQQILEASQNLPSKMNKTYKALL